MPIWTIEGTPEQPIPRPVGKARTHYCIVALPENKVVAEGTASKSISADLDPGYYRIVVAQTVASGGNVGLSRGSASRMKWRKDFYHQITAEQHAHIRSASLRFTKGMLGTEGMRYLCQLPGCETELTSRTAAILHEAEHSGVDLLKSIVHPGDMPPPKVNVDAVLAVEQQKKDATVQRLRKAALEG